MGLFSRPNAAQANDTSWTYAVTPDPKHLDEARRAGKKSGKKWVPLRHEMPEFLGHTRAAFAAENENRGEAMAERCRVSAHQFREAVNNSATETAVHHLAVFKSHLDRYYDGRQRQLKFYAAIETAFLQEARPQWERRNVSWTAPGFELADAMESEREEYKALEQQQNRA